jgi:hypothetical protein
MCGENRYGQYLHSENIFLNERAIRGEMSCQFFIAV